MAKCIKCGKTHKRLFKQWATFTESGDCDICASCIRKYKMYHTITSYAPDMDMTFIFVEARAYLKQRPLSNYFVLLSQTLIGYCYGHPDTNKDYVDWAVSQWLNNKGKDRLNLLRQTFNENQRNEEVLY